MAIGRSEANSYNNNSNHDYTDPLRSALLVAEQKAREAWAMRDPRVLDSLKQQHEAKVRDLRALAFRASAMRRQNNTTTTTNNNNSRSRSRSRSNNKAREWRLAFIAKFQAERRLETITQSMGDDHDDGAKEEALRSALAAVSEAKAKLQSLQYNPVQVQP